MLQWKQQLQQKNQHFSVKYASAHFEWFARISRANVLKHPSLWEWWDLAHLTIFILWLLSLCVLWWGKSSIRKEIGDMQLFFVRKLEDKICELPKEYLKNKKPENVILT